jgi:uncharacterized protein (TIGR03790 family)
MSAGDLWLTNVATVARRHGYETVVDIFPDTMRVAQPFAQVAVYAGWYAAGIDGPFKLPVVEFMPGAIAYHLHSFSAFALRSQEANWVGPLITKGATVTLGCIEEPYPAVDPKHRPVRGTPGGPAGECRRGGDGMSAGAVLADGGDR